MNLFVSAQEGSSPLARGLPLYPADGGDRIRIIPARAGFTTSVGRDGPK